MSEPGSPLHVLVVVLQAADGAAFSRFLRDLRPTPALALVAMPLGAEDHAACVQALGGLPDGIRAMRLAQDTPLVADCLYVIPPGTAISVEDAHLRLAAFAGGSFAGSTGSAVAAVEASLTALAESLAGSLLVVLFAGAARRVDAGKAAIAAAGGLLLQEAEPDAQAAGLPASAHPAHPAHPALPTLAAQVYGHLLQLTGGGIPLGTSDELERILRLVARQTGIDFGEYKKSTLLRRIQRRMAVNQLAEVAAYVALLGESPTELATLYREMLISVTRFFRDPEAFQALDLAVIRPLVASPAPRAPIRVWVAGCATGEEAYSVAILLREALLDAGTEVPVKIFATDLDQEAVRHASAGRYPAGIAGELSPARLARFFVPHGDGFQVAKEIREMVVFATHDIVRDPPFFRMDLVTCRNLLIYLQPALQRRLLSAFHFALAPDRHLLLGPSETLGDMAPYFATVDSTWRIHRKRGEREPRFGDGLAGDRPHHRTRPPGAAPGDRPATGDGILEAIRHTLLQEFMPAFLIADEHCEIHYISGRVERYLTLPNGRPTFNLLKMAPRGLALALGTGIRRALGDGHAVVYEDLPRGDDADGDALGESSARMRLVIRPFLQPELASSLVVVVFEEPGAAAQRPAERLDLALQGDRRIRDLEAELEHTKAGLQAAIEELESSNEELQATNEELLAANEESQSVNEELHTVNAGHQARIGELTGLNNDILDLLGSTGIGTVFLDQRLCVRRFTHAATTLINLIDQDIGRPLAHLSNNIGQPQLAADAAEVLRTQVPRQRTVGTADGRWYLMRMLPYRAAGDVIAGVVITFSDSGEVRLAGDLLRTLVAVIDDGAAMALITDAAGDVVYVNHAFSALTGWSAADALGRNPRFLRHPDDTADAPPGLRDALRAGRPWCGRFHNRRRDGEPFWEDAVVIPCAAGGGRAGHVLKLATIAGDPG